MKIGNKLLASVLCLLAVALCVVGLTACGGDEKCSHQWGEWTITTNATCTEAGSQERKCSVCGETEKSAIEALGHDWNEATCSTPKTCKTCSATEAAASAHAYTVETVKDEALKSAANCTSGAVYYKSCSCGAISTSDADTFTSGEALGHKDENTDHACDNSCGKNDLGTHADENKDHACDYGCAQAIGTCEDADKDHNCDYGCTKTFGTCEDADKDHDCDYGCTKVFGEHTDGNDNNHLCDHGCGVIADDGCYDTVVDGKCDECGADIEHPCADENTDHACDICSATMGEHADTNKDHACDYGCTKAIGEHSDSKTDDDHVCDYGCEAVLEDCYDSANDGNHTCDVCGNADISSHSYGDATCGAPATCSECGATTGSTLEHIDENYDHICDNNCGKNDLGTHSDSATDDDHVCDYGCQAVLENCSDADTDDDHDCDVCGKANVTSHTHVENTELATEATCNTPATKTYECNCGDTYTEDDGDVLGHNITGVTPTERQVDVCEYVLVYVCQNDNCDNENHEVLGETVYHHSYVASIGTPATCLTAGEKTFKCSACGDTSKAAEPIPADTTGHRWETGTVIDGVRTDKCSVCAAEKTVTVYTGNKTDEVNAGDLADKEIELNDANISLDSGVIDTIGDQNVTVSADKLEGDDRADLGLSKEQLDQVGNNPIYNFTINNGTENISDFGEDNYVTITLPYTLAEGEDVDSIAVWFINDEGELESIKATYNNGYVTFKTNHFSYYTVTRLTPAERCALYGHGYAEQVVEGSCTKDGYVLLVCIRCHDKQIKEGTFVAADGHDYVAETHEATCTENGYVIYTCVDCDHSYRTKINATGHAWSVVDSLEATCTVDGYTKYGCENCDNEYTVTYAKLAHVYTSTVVPATCTADGYTIHDCDNCDYSYTNAYVDALGHAYKSTTWAFATDYSSATLTFVCENDDEHVMVLNATVTETVVNGTCSNFVKTTYTATVSYGGVNYTEEKVVESGSPDHDFSSDWKKDEGKHWHECVCGEKTDIGEHKFENAVITKNATCNEAGESTAYCVCGETKVTVIPATGEHNYVDGICTECGAEFVDTYYLNLINSWKNIDEFAIKIQNFTYEIKEQESNLLESLTLIGSIKQIDVAELALYIEDGKLCGAAIGSVTIYNGPIANAEAIYIFKAVIQDGYVYISLDNGQNVADKNTSIKMSVDALIESMLENWDIGSESLYALGFLKETIIPVMDTLVEMHSEDVNTIFENIFNILFTFEKQADGSYIAALDYDKLHTLNENLATKSVAEVVDIYFGEGTFDGIVEFILEILDLEISEIPDYLDENGIDSAAIIEKLNELAAQTGAPDGYDVSDFINGEELEGVTVGMLMFGVQDDSYIEIFNEAIDYLREKSLYEMINANMVDEIKEGISNIIDMISGSVSVTFTTDRLGMITSIDIDVDEFTYTMDDEEIYVSFNLDIIINGRIDVTWTDIIEEIENSIALPEDDMLEGTYAYCNQGYSGYVTYKGKEYWYSNGMRIVIYKPDYDNLTSVMFTNDCAGWTGFEVNYAEHTYRFTLMALPIDGEMVTLLVDEISGEVVELVETEAGCTAIFEDGTEKSVTFTFPENSEDIADFYTDLCFAIFDAPGSEYYLLGYYVGYYYNASLNEYATETQHEYEYEYEVLGDCCDEDGCIVHVTCKNCDYSYDRRTYWCEYEYGVEIDFSEYSSCGGTITVTRCKICGDIKYINDIDINCDMGDEVEEEILDADGNVIGYECICTCPDCGLVFVEREWVEIYSECECSEFSGSYIYYGDECLFNYVTERYYDSHEYEYTYELEGNDCSSRYKVIARCVVCGKTEEWWGSGHNMESFTIDFTDYNGCEGTIYGRRCAICGEITSVYNMNVGCDFDEETEPEEFIDENGKIHYVTTMICPDCGLKFVVDRLTVQASVCVTYEYQTTYIYYGDECIFEYMNMYSYVDHQYEYSYQMQGDTCNDGYYVTRYCSVCGENYGYYGQGHDVEWRDIYLDEFGLCGGHIQERYCRVCDTVIELYCDDWCDWRYVEETDEGYSVYECYECGAIKTDGYYRIETEETCKYIRIEFLSYMVNGEEVYTGESSYTEWIHNYKYEFEMNGASCTDGYILYTICSDCGETWTDERTDHYTDTLFELGEGYGCCDDHYIEIIGCPCGYSYYVEFDAKSFVYDRQLQKYTCRKCALTITKHVDSVEFGCTVVETNTTIIEFAGEVIYSYEKEITCSNHSFGGLEVILIDGVTYCTNSCDRCGAVRYFEVLDVEMEEHRGSYYYEYTFTPDETGFYTIAGLADKDTYVVLYKLVAGQLIAIGENDDSGPNGQFRLTANLTAGVTYVYKIGFYGYDEEGTVMFAFSHGTGSDASCDHYGERREYTVLLEGSTTCEDGVLCIEMYTSCGCLGYVYVDYKHEVVEKEIIDLSQYGACYGEVIKYACACGEEDEWVASDICADSWTFNEYYDEEGRWIEVTVISCDKCSLRHTESTYSVKDHENCMITYYGKIVISIGGYLIAEEEYIDSQEYHDYDVTGTLLGGIGSSCEDGVIINKKCKYCGDEYSYEVYHHMSYDRESIDLLELGSVCGGYVTVSGCACGRYASVNTDHVLCDFDTKNCPMWIENAITGYQYTISGSQYFSYSAYIYTCAVTDPTACAYKIRYASYWLKDANSCTAYRYQTWQFGYNEETGTYEYEITLKSGSGRVYHNYADNSTDDNTRYNCRDCGSYYYKDRYYNSNGDCIKYEETFYNTLNNGEDKYHHRVEEYVINADGSWYTRREYYEYIDSEGEQYWSEVLRNMQSYSGPFGTGGEKVVYSYSDSNGESYSEEYADVWYKGYNFMIYTHRTEGNEWYNYDYSYTFTDGCVQTSVYTSSNGDYEVNVDNICRFWNGVTIKAPTCTQDGEGYDKCVVCDKCTESHTISPNDHNWAEIFDGWYYCFDCGLENANGASGSIIMEDLTDAYGNGEYYVVGYYAYNDITFSKYISLILADGNEVAIWSGIDFITIDGIRAYAFSKAAVDEWAAANGYTDYDVRFSFVPDGAEGSFDYGITFAEPTVITGAITGNVSFKEYVGAGETKTFTITPTEDALWVFMSFADSDTYAFLTDENGERIARDDDSGQYNNFMIMYDLKAGNTYIINVRWYDNYAVGTMPLFFGVVPTATK